MKDTYHFIQKLKNISVPAEAFLFTIDIDSLYGNIDTMLGLQAVKNTFSRYPDPQRPDTQLLDLLQIGLTQYYLQIHGMAMGKNFAPAYANIHGRMGRNSPSKVCLIAITVLQVSG